MTAANTFLMGGYPPCAPLPPSPRRVRAVRPRATSVVDEVFAEFGRAVEAGDSHVQDRLVDKKRVAHPETSRRPRDPRPDGGAT